MNLVDVIVASSLLLGACGGAAQMGSSSAQAMAHSRSRLEALENLEAQLLAVPPVLQAAAAAGQDRDCSSAARWMQQQLVAAMPPLPQGVERQLALAPGGEQVVLVLSGPDGLRRQRLYSPVAFGLCGGITGAQAAEPPAEPPAEHPALEPGDATL